MIKKNKIITSGILFGLLFSTFSGAMDVERQIGVLQRRLAATKQTSAKRQLANQIADLEKKLSPQQQKQQQQKQQQQQQQQHGSASQTDYDKAAIFMGIYANRVRKGVPLSNEEIDEISALTVDDWEKLLVRTGDSDQQGVAHLVSAVLDHIKFHQQPKTTKKPDLGGGPGGSGAGVGAGITTQGAQSNALKSVMPQYKQVMDAIADLSKLLHTSTKKKILADMQASLQVK